MLNKWIELMGCGIKCVVNIRKLQTHIKTLAFEAFIDVPIVSLIYIILHNITFSVNYTENT